MDDNERIDMVPSIQQKLMWDILPCAQVGEYWDAMKLVPPGPDVAEAAHADSHTRMRRVAPLQPICEMMIVLTSDIITAVMHQQLLSGIDTDDMHQVEMAETARTVMTARNREVVRGSLYATLAHLIEGGFLTVNQQVTV